jgi:hypothetical protein
MNTPAAEKLRLIKNLPGRAIAEAALLSLKNHGIEAILQSSDIVGGGMAQGCDLYVQEKDADTARDLLESLFDNM